MKSYVALLYAILNIPCKFASSQTIITTLHPCPILNFITIYKTTMIIIIFMFTYPRILMMRTKYWYWSFLRNDYLFCVIELVTNYLNHFVDNHARPIENILLFILIAEFFIPEIPYTNDLCKYNFL